MCRNGQRSGCQVSGWTSGVSDVGRLSVGESSSVVQCEAARVPLCKAAQAATLFEEHLTLDTLVGRYQANAQCEHLRRAVLIVPYSVYVSSIEIVDFGEAERAI